MRLKLERYNCVRLQPLEAEFVVDINVQNHLQSVQVEMITLKNRLQNILEKNQKSMDIAIAESRVYFNSISLGAQKRDYLLKKEQLAAGLYLIFSDVSAFTIIIPIQI